jgi:hypothetical protein
MIVALFLTLVIVIAFLSSETKYWQNLSRKHRSFLEDCPQHKALWFSGKELSSSSIAIIPRKRAIIAYAADGVRLVIENASLNNDARLKLSPKHYQIRKLELGAFGGKWATLIELKLPKSDLYFAATQYANASPKTTRKLFDELSRYFNLLPPINIISRWERALTILFFVIMLASIGYTFHSLSGGAPTGPLFVSQTSTGKLLALNRSHLLFFNSDGRLTDAHHTPNFDYRGAALLDNDRFYVMDRSSKSLLRCAEAYCSPVSIKAEPPLETDIALAVSPDGQHLITSESTRDRVRVFSIGGEQLQVLAQPDHALCFPNGGTFGRDGKFYLTDSNHHRVAVFSFENGHLQEEQEHLMVAKRPESAGEECKSGKTERFWKRAFPKDKATTLKNVRKGRVWPMDIAQLADGRWAVLIARNGMKNSDIVLFDEDWRNPAPLSMPYRSDIVSITSWGDGLAGADLEAPGLWRITEKQIIEWNDPAFGHWMKNIDEQKRLYQQRPFMLVFFLISVLTGIILIALWKFTRLSRYVRNSRQAAIEASI